MKIKIECDIAFSNIHRNRGKRNPYDFFSEKLVIKEYKDSLDVRIYNSASMHIKFVTWAIEHYLEITFLTFIAKPLLVGFSKGFFNEEYFRMLGKESRELLLKEINLFKNYLEVLYKTFISKQLSEYGAISLVEHVDGVVYYAVLNHKKSSQNLIDKLVDAMIRAIGEISLGRININGSIPTLVQLYPDFNRNEWNYLFFPSDRLDYIKYYFDFTQNTIINLDSKKSFANRFSLDENDKIMVWAGMKPFDFDLSE